MGKTFTLSVLPHHYAVCRMDAGSAVPEWAVRCEFFSVVRTDEELSIVCVESDVPAGVRSQAGWRCLKIAGPLDFELTGVLSTILQPLAAGGVSIFAISTFDTDYILIKSEKLDQAVSALRGDDHQVVGL